jgi:hypothetical protein
MSRTKPAQPARGRSLELPPWWLAALRRLCAERSVIELAAELTAVARRTPPFRRESVYDFLQGKLTTDAMLVAFLRMFPKLPPPVYWARNYEEADRMRAVAADYEGPSPWSPSGAAEAYEANDEDEEQAAPAGSGSRGTRRRSK